MHSRKAITLIILAGGASARMGRPKHLLPTRDGTMIDSIRLRLGILATETLVVGRSLSLAGEGLRCVEDAFSTQSPLVGIYSGLRSCRTDLAIVTACDMPHISRRLVQLLLERSDGADVVGSRPVKWCIEIA